MKLIKHLGLNPSNKKIFFFRCQINNIVRNICNYINKGLHVGFLSDAGILTISDPGNYILNELRLNNYMLKIITGSVSLAIAIVGSGLNCSRFTFLGFLTRNIQKRKKIIKNCFYNTCTLICFETSFRVNSTLNDIYYYYGHTRFTIIRELTKIYETYHYGILGQYVYPWLFYKGEFIIIIEFSRFIINDIFKIKKKI